MIHFSKKNIVFIALGLFFFFAGMCTISYFFKKDADHFKEEFIASSNEKEVMLDSLYGLKATYQIAIAENEALSKELEVEKMKVEELIRDLRNSNSIQPNQFVNFKSRFQLIKKTLAVKTEEIAALKSENKQLLSEIQTQNVRMYEQILQKDTLIKQKEELVSKVKKAENLILKDFKLIGIKQKKSSEATVTDKANKVDKLVVSFIVQGNNLAKTGTKSYFVQVIDQNNMVMGERHTIVLEDSNKLIYSFTMDVNYQNKDVNAFGFLEPIGKHFEKGTYFLKVFDNKDVIGTSSLTLR